ncbi:MAG: hypothetical protein PHD48_03365 [Alphaproteobacteria bacterium]|nr:hypothetical protein [Alphaproteobacteria bacterium]
MDHFLLVMEGVGSQNTLKVQDFSLVYKKVLAGNARKFVLYVTNNIPQLAIWPYAGEAVYRRQPKVGIVQSAINHITNLFFKNGVQYTADRCRLSCDMSFSSLIFQVAAINRKASVAARVEQPPVKGLVVFSIGDLQLPPKIPECTIAAFKMAGTRTLIVACPTGSYGTTFEPAQLETCQRFAKYVGGLCLQMPSSGQTAIAEAATLSALSMILPDPTCEVSYPQATTPEGRAFKQAIILHSKSSNCRLFS